MTDLKEFTKNLLLECTEITQRSGFRAIKINYCEIISLEQSETVIKLILLSIVISVFIYLCGTIILSVSSSIIKWIFSKINLQWEQSNSNNRLNLAQTAAFDLASIYNLNR
jgi:hypothetical protein